MDKESTFSKLSSFFLHSEPITVIFILYKKILELIFNFPKVDRETRLNRNVRNLYHQTNFISAYIICKNQKMIRGKSGWAGGGIYFAATDVETNKKAQQRGVILQARVRLGNELHVSGNESNLKKTHFTQLEKDGYDSVRIDSKSGYEYVVYNHDQVSNIKVFKINYYFFIEIIIQIFLSIFIIWLIFKLLFLIFYLLLKIFLEAK